MVHCLKWNNMACNIHNLFVLTFSDGICMVSTATFWQVHDSICSFLPKYKSWYTKKSLAVKELIWNHLFHTSNQVPWTQSNNFKILTCIQCIDKPGPVYNFLWHIWHLKCLAFWCWIRIFSSSNSRLQYLVYIKENAEHWLPNQPSPPSPLSTSNQSGGHELPPSL
jgi:hypothetical protein